MKNNTFNYTGCDNLEVMTEAKNYNKFLIGLVTGSGAHKVKSKAKILDFGAGSGTYSDMLKEDHGIVTDCLEPDASLRKLLAQKGYKVFPGIEDLKPSSYDIIYALNVFEHIEDDHKTLKQLTKALKKGGKIVVYVPAFQALFTAMDEKVGHHRRYKTERLKTMAEEANLHILQLKYCDPLGFAAALAYKYVGSKEGDITPRSIRIYDRLIFPLSKVGHPVTKKLVGKNVVLIAQKR